MDLTGSTDYLTPNNIRKGGPLALVLPHYTSLYRGGRNESFMYGYDDKTRWYDYDLTSAYTTVMCMLHHPKYKGFVKLSRTKFKSVTDEDLMRSYFFISGTFKFPDSVKYPSIPVDLPKVGPGPLINIYPKKGRCTLTGCEYLLAVRIQKCAFEVDEVIKIPADVEAVKPFETVMNALQRERRKYPKGTLPNVLYKLLGNGGYGLLCKGFSDKRSFDIESKSTKRMPANDISNIILGGVTTALARCIIGELLHNISVLGGKAVSVTTDGFITDIENLEDCIRNSKLEGISTKFLDLYRKTREGLSGDPNALELKTSVVGLLSWCVRGQYSDDGKLAAATGLQRYSVGSNSVEVGELLKGVMFNKGDKTLRYLQKRLRSGREIYETGYHVCDINQERDFNLLSDNRRMYIPNEDGCGFNDSKPFDNVEQCDLNRYVGNLGRVVKYQRSVSVDIPVDVKKHSGSLDTAVRKFIRSIFVKEYNLYYEGLYRNYTDLLMYIFVLVTGDGFVNGVKMNPANLQKDSFNLTVNNISTLKRRHLKHGPLKDQSRDVLAFVDNIVRSNVYQDFDVEGFLHKFMKNDPVKGEVSHPINKIDGYLNVLVNLPKESGDGKIINIRRSKFVRDVTKYL